MDSKKTDKEKINNDWYAWMLEDSLSDNQLWHLYILSIIAMKCDVRRSIIDWDIRIIQSSFSSL